MRMNELSFIVLHACSKQVQKDSSREDEEEEQASPLREHRQTLLLPPRWWPRSHLQEGGGGGSPGDGYVLEGPAGQPRWWSSSRLNLLEHGCRQQGTCQPTCPQTGRFRGVQVHGKKSLEGVEKGRVD